MAAQTLAIVRTVAELRERVGAWRTAGDSVGFAPTMGALHEGHLTLVRAALGRCDRAIVSIFVNPKQFAPTEDFDRYPRDESRDAAMLASAGASLLFAPGVDEMYPAGEATTVTVSGSLTAGLCGPHRPGHFAGVATVVAKLLNQAQASDAFFGEKDFQQLQVIRRMVRDLEIPTAIHGVPTVREADGLALSSRNAYLTPAQRRTASALPATLRDLAARAARAEDPRALEAEGASRLIDAGFDSVDYVAIARSGDLAAAQPGEMGEARVLAAVRIGATRLIDNWPVLPAS
jgi:pantoate--beta-alanine ligase